MNDAPGAQWLSAALCDVIRQKCLPRYGVAVSGYAMHQQERLARTAAADELERILGDERGGRMLDMCRSFVALDRAASAEMARHLAEPGRLAGARAPS